MSILKSLKEPTLLLDESKCRANIRRMVEKAQKNNTRLRPHFKTHVSRQIGEWFREEGITSITVSSVKMATYFAEYGWKDITVALPANTLEKDRINRLAKNISLHLITADIEDTKLLASILDYKVTVWIKVDVNYHRTGVLHSDFASMDAMLDIMQHCDHLSFGGFLTHAGQSYHCKSHEEILAIHRETISIMHNLAQKYKTIYPNIAISVGDTPTCTVADDFTLVDEIRPGNFVFFDVMQVKISSCNYDDIAVALACPVVAKHGDRNEIILYGGGIHFSKDFLDMGDGIKSFGELVLVGEKGWGEPLKDCYMSKLSQEHGTLKVTEAVFQKIVVGDMVAILPVHSCMTANLMAGYTTLDGKKYDYFDTRKEYFL